MGSLLRGMEIPGAGVVAWQGSAEILVEANADLPHDRRPVVPGRSPRQRTLGRDLNSSKPPMVLGENPECVRATSDGV
ncbi:MAG: hypothetical protein GY937_12125 [bacterium]|nr:hypothetical protein [bacterium]